MIQRSKSIDLSAAQCQPVSRRPWRHPYKRGLQVPYRTATAIALMEMGVRDYRQIATATGSSECEIKKIDLCQDQHVRQLGCEGIPYGEYFRLEKALRCPKCRAILTLVPCVACDSPGKYRVAQQRGRV